MLTKLVKITLVISLMALFSVKNVVAQETIIEAQPIKAVKENPTPDGPINLTVSPITLKFETDPGGSSSSTIKIMNNSNSSEYLKLELMRFEADTSGSKPILKEFEADDDYQKWLSFDKQQFEVKAKEWQTIKVFFNPPVNSSLTYYYAIVVKRQKEAEFTETTAVTGAPAILVLSLINSPNAKRELQLIEFSSKKKIYEYLPTDFEIKVKNTGNVHLAPIGNVFIDKKNKKDIAILSFNQANGLVLPQSTRYYETSWLEGFPVFENKKLVWDFTKVNNFRFGRYTANLVMVYDNGQRDIPAEASLTFWVIPWKLILILLFILFLIIMGLVLILKTFTKAIVKKKGFREKIRNNL